MSRVLQQLQRDCPQMWCRCDWQLSDHDGEGWSGILLATTHTISQYITRQRKARLDSLLYNRALRRAISGDTWQLYYQLWRQDRLNIAGRVGDDRRAIEITDEREARVAELIANPGYKTLPDDVSWPRIVSISSINSVEDPLMYKLAWTCTPQQPVNEYVGAALLMMRRMSGHVCRWCGSKVDFNHWEQQARPSFPFGQPKWSVGVCGLCQLEIGGELGVAGIDADDYPHLEHEEEET